MYVCVLLFLIISANAYCISSLDKSDDCLRKGTYAPDQFPTIKSRPFEPIPPPPPVKPYQPPPVVIKPPAEPKMELFTGPGYVMGMNAVKYALSHYSRTLPEADPKNY